MPDMFKIIYINFLIDREDSYSAIFGAYGILTDPHSLFPFDDAIDFIKHYRTSKNRIRSVGDKNA